MTDPDQTQVSAAVPLLEPRDGLPTVVADPDSLLRTIESYADGTGPVAVDAERASGYRYGHRAFLIQLRRRGAGSALIDPVACPDLSGLGEVIAEDEWILHAAHQDLPCLADVGLVPNRLFDTELAGRLLSYPRVGLGALTEAVLGYALEKGHSAVDWSTRPLPEPWLRYAALDVELLLELRDELEVELREQGKLPWALEEFAHLVVAPAPVPRTDPWRRTSGLHRVRNRHGLAVVRALWEERDELARQRDVSPGRVLADAAIVEAALALPRTNEAFAALPSFRARGARRDLPRWQRTISEALRLPEDELPAPTLRYDGPPPARAWADRDPVAAARLAAAREAIQVLAEEHRVPVENLLAPETLRRIVWEPPQPGTTAQIADAMRSLGAREWQIRLTAEAVAGASAA